MCTTIMALNWFTVRFTTTRRNTNLMFRGEASGLNKNQGSRERGMATVEATGEMMSAYKIKDKGGFDISTVVIL